MLDLLGVILATALTSNLLLDGSLGLSAAFAVTRTDATGAGLGLAVAVVVAIAAPLAAGVHTLVLVPLGATSLTLLATLLIVVLSARALALGARVAPGRLGHLAIYEPLVVLNSAVLGAVLQAGAAPAGVVATIAGAVGAGTGYAAVLVVLASLRERLATVEVPAACRGVPITCITLGLLGMAMLGLRGLGA
ncbi:MAG: hypothetical protein IT495_01325 [Gammaproteobacteria bacterium]|nr:hypothetical protein [Gammaproteobacteria bacterium]